MAAIQPMEQFLVHKIVDIRPIPVPGLGALDLSITNSVMFMLIAAGLICAFFVSPPNASWCRGACRPPPNCSTQRSIRC